MGLLVSWLNGSMVQWLHASMVQWFSGPKVSPLVSEQAVCFETHVQISYLARISYNILLMSLIKL